MSESLQVDTVVLVDAGSQLRVVAAEFNSADDFAAQVAASVGHAGLADKVRESSTSWDDKRTKMFEQIGGLAEACSSIGDNFNQLDTAFAAAIRGEAS